MSAGKRHSRGALPLLLACGLVCHGPVLADHRQDLELRLKQIDAMRTANPVLFNREVAKLAQSDIALAPHQAELLRYFQAYQLAYAGRMAEAIDAYRHLFENTSDANIRYRSALSLVNLFTFQHRWLEGFKYLDHIFEHAREIQNDNLRHEGLLVAAMFYNALNENESALAALDQIKEPMTARNRCLKMGVRIQVLVHMRSSDLTEDDFDQAVDFCRKSREELLALIIRTKQATNALRQGNYQQAENLVRQHLPEGDKKKYPRFVIESNSILAQALLAQKKYRAAARAAQAAIDSSGDSQAIEPVLAAYQVLYQVMQHDNKPEQALRYLQQVLSLKEQEYQQNKAKSLAVQMAKFEIQQRDLAIRTLNQKNQILQLRKNLDEERIRRGRWVLGGAGSLIAVLLLWLWQSRRRQRQLQFLSEHDSLTGISNRLCFRQKAEAALKQLAVQQEPAGMILFDMDEFKKINDTYGHQVGDDVLRRAARTCTEQLPPEAIAGRIGGEEFAIFLPGASVADTATLAESCRRAMQRALVQTPDKTISFSASFGVTDTRLSGYVFHRILADADKAMYAAKASGRNQVRVHVPSDQEGCPSYDSHVQDGDPSAQF